MRGKKKSNASSLKEVNKKIQELWGEGWRLYDIECTKLAHRIDDLEIEARKLDDNARKLWNEDNDKEGGKKLWNEAGKLHDEAKKLEQKADILESMGVELIGKGNRILRDFIDKNYEKKVKIYHENGRIILSNGIILYNDGRVYEPLDVVMRKIIKEHEEEESEKAKKS